MTAALSIGAAGAITTIVAEPLDPPPGPVEPTGCASETDPSSRSAL